jgi:mono/diheme cytochrome c family protein
MHNQPKYTPLRPSTFFADGLSAREPVAGTIPRGHLDEDTLLYAGKEHGQPAEEFPFAVDDKVMARGQERFNIYCSPCHGRTGEGNGMVVQRGFRKAANYHVDRLRQAPAGYFFDVITNGFGVMPDYKGQIPVRDRWLIIAYIRALQLSHDAPASDVPAAELAKLGGGKGE